MSNKKVIYMDVSFIQPGLHGRTFVLFPVMCFHKERCEEVCHGVISYFGNRFQEVGLLNQRINAIVILIDIIAIFFLSLSNQNNLDRKKGGVRKFSTMREISFLILPCKYFTLVKVNFELLYCIL